MKETTLVIMAAGIGSRFGGGIKQLEPVGPNGEIIMDYSIYDALEAGFNKIVFIIRKDLEKDFKEIIGNRIERITPVEYAYQELNNLPYGFNKPDYRTKPWGTGHALLCAKDLIHNPFVVINADDYYGKEGFVKIHDYLVKQMNSEAECLDICMAGFQIGNTLSENGGVTRGVCEIKKDGTLTRVTETYEITGQTEFATGKTENGTSVKISLEQNVSMNMWGLSPAFIDELENGFPLFLSNIKEGDGKEEYLLPKIVDQLIRTGKAKVKVLETHDKWFGVTYKEDKPDVSLAVKNLVAEGVYPNHLY